MVREARRPARVSGGRGICTSLRKRGTLTISGAEDLPEQSGTQQAIISGRENLLGSRALGRYSLHTCVAVLLHRGRLFDWFKLG